MKTEDKLKEKIQHEATNYISQYDNLFLEWATSAGKTLAALKIIDRLKGNWYILCKETNHINNWLEEINKHGYQHLLKYITLFCYSSLHKHLNTNANLILDECHGAISELRIERINTIHSEKRVFLSAKIPILKYRALEKLFTNKSVYRFTISMDNAINSNMLPEPTIYIVDCVLNDDKVTEKYIKTKGKAKKALKFFCSAKEMIRKLTELKRKKIDNYQLTVNCTEQEYYQLITKDINYFGRRATFSIFYKHKWLNLGAQRKTFVANCKTKYLKPIIEKHKSSRFVCFTGSIKQSEHFSKNTVNSNRAKDKNQIIIDKFNNGEISEIFAVKMLRESMNFKNIEVGIVTQLDSEELSFIQMLGRCFRAEHPIIYVLVMRNTRDEVYLQNALKEIDPKFIKTY